MMTPLLFYGSESAIRDPDAGLYSPAWDGERELLVFYRDSRAVDQAAIKIYSGSTLRTAIFPLRDFPSASSIMVWAVATLPAGGVALSGVLDFGKGQTKLVLLTYAADGSLKQLWDMKNRHNYSLVADDQGNIYALGFPVETGDSPQASYMMLAKYSPEGELLKEFLPRSDYAYLEKATMIDPAKGESRLLIWHNLLVLYLANAHQVSWFDTDGRSQQTVDLGSLLKSVATTYNSTSAIPKRVIVTAEGNYLMQVSLFGSNAQTDTVVLQVSQNGTKWNELSSNCEQLLGLDSQNQYVVLERRQNQFVLANYAQLP